MIQGLLAIITVIGIVFGFYAISAGIVENNTRADYSAFDENFN